MLRDTDNDARECHRSRDFNGNHRLEIVAEKVSLYENPPRQALTVHRGGLEDFGGWTIDNDKNTRVNCPSWRPRKTSEDFILSKVLPLLEF